MKNSEFVIGKVPITKEEVRAISISKLNLVKAKNFIDIGAGTGSVSIEAAYNYPNLNVISIEKNDVAIELIEKNIKKFDLKNIEVIKGYAPIDVGLNTQVESIFLGGTGNNLEEIIEWSKNNLVIGGRLVANFIIMDTFNQTLKLLKKYGFKEIDVSVLNVSKLEKLGKGEYFKPLNPIYIISCEKGENDYE